MFEFVIILSMHAYVQLRRVKSTLNTMLTCNQMINSATGAVALLWRNNDGAVTPQGQKLAALKKQLMEKMDCTEFLMLGVSDTGEAASEGC